MYGLLNNTPPTHTHKTARVWRKMELRVEQELAPSPLWAWLSQVGHCGGGAGGGGGGGGVQNTGLCPFLKGAQQTGSLSTLDPSPAGQASPPGF